MLPFLLPKLSILEPLLFLLCSLSICKLIQSPGFRYNYILIPPQFRPSASTSSLSLSLWQLYSLDIYSGLSLPSTTKPYSFPDFTHLLAQFKLLGTIPYFPSPPTSSPEQFSIRLTTKHTQNWTTFSHLSAITPVQTSIIPPLESCTSL